MDNIPQNGDTEQRESQKRGERHVKRGARESQVLVFELMRW